MPERLTCWRRPTPAFAPGGILTRIDLTLLSLHAAPGVKPVELIAAAATCCQSSQCSLARAILHFGVAHAVRLRATQPTGRFR